MKKKSLLVFLIALSFNAISQKNEFLALPGITTYQFYIDQSAVFQYKYERAIGKNTSIQAGMRYHNEIEQKSINGISQWIQYSFNSYKLDATFLLIPVNRERFKLKAGMGFDIG
nr:hypothetical protein [Prolixibacteraceae bacterium]